MITAISLRTHLPQSKVRVLRSPTLGVIGVGEASTPDLPYHLHTYLGIDPGEFLRKVRPSWKLGIRFEWGDRLDHFNYGFVPSWNKRFQDARSRQGIPLGFLAEEHFNLYDGLSALMEHGKAFPRNERGEIDLKSFTGYHIENESMVAWLEAHARSIGIEVIDGDCAEAQTGPEGITCIRDRDGRSWTADLYIDASGFRAELIGKALQEPLVSYADTLFCDRAVVGGWTRTDEPILPYTVAESMRHGWSWQIDHHDRIHRGYVYASAFVSDDEAEREFRARNPRLEPTHVIPFVSGRRRRQWVGNVFAVGNASGFVEPLESTAILVLCTQARNLVAILSDSDQRPTPGLREACNRYCAATWDEIRDFLSVHHRFNGRFDTPYWRTARAEVALHGAERIVDFYRENGPSTVTASDLLAQRTSIFGLNGYWNLLLGQGVPHGRRDVLDTERRAQWKAYTAANDAFGRGGVTVEEAFALASSPQVQWPANFFSRPG